MRATAGQARGLAGVRCTEPAAVTWLVGPGPANADVPVFLAHGTRDPIVPYARAVASRDVLLAMGYPVEWHEYPMPHSVCAPEIADLNRWLLRVLG